MPRLAATWYIASVKHPASEARNTSLGWGPVSPPPALSGSSMWMRNWRVETVQRYPPSQVDSTESVLAPKVPVGVVGIEAVVVPAVAAGHVRRATVDGRSVA